MFHFAIIITLFNARFITNLFYLFIIIIIYLFTIQYSVGTLPTHTTAHNARPSKGVR